MIYVIGGGGANLNFKVVGGTTQPTSPKENTIWVNTDTKISEWVFSATQPSYPYEGMVWFGTGTSSGAEFNALKKNQIHVYPIYAKQYVSGSWVNKTAKTYKSGTWNEWSKTLLPASDILSRLVTGGQPVTPQYSSNVLTLSLTNTTWVYLEEDVSAFNTLEIVGNRSAASTTLDVGILNSSNNLASGRTLTSSSQDFTVTCDISALTGKQRIGVKANLNSQTQQTTVVKITSIVLK